MTAVAATVTTTTAPRAAVQIDPAALEDFQAAARLVLAHPLVTERWPHPGALASVRRWQPALGNELSRVLGYRLDVARSCARLYRRAAAPSPARAAFTRTERPLGRWACTLLCLALAALESSGEQTTLSRLADDILRTRAGDDALPVDLTQYDQRKALVDAVSWLADRGVITLRDGVADRWLHDQDGDALYDIDRDIVSRLLVSSPSVLRDVERVADFLDDPVPAGTDAQQIRLRHRIARRLLTEPVLYYSDLPDDELAHAKWRRTRIVTDIERLTGCTVECRAEGWTLIDVSNAAMSRVEFPAGGAVAHAALLFGSQLLGVADATDAGATDDGHEQPSRGRAVARHDLDRAWDDVLDAYRDRFKAVYRDRPDKLRREATTLLVHLGLVIVNADASIVVRPAMSRYRPTVHLVDKAPDQMSLLDDAP